MNQDAAVSRNSEGSAGTGTGSAQRPERFVAVPVSVAEILDYAFIRQEGWQPSYLLTNNRRRLGRVSVMGLLIGKPDDHTLLVDDGSGVISVRAVDASPALAVGEVVHLLARVGEVGGQRYLLAEVVRKLKNPAWLHVRRLELRLRGDDIGEAALETAPPDRPAPSAIPPRPAYGSTEVQPIVSLETVRNRAEESGPEGFGVDEPQGPPAQKSPAERLCALIKIMDAGGGVDMSDLMKRAEAEGISNSERLMQSLLEQGEVFVPRPGLVKTLE